MAEGKSREGWEPEIGRGLSLAEVIEEAFDYRGDVTVVGTDDTEMVGYLFNRDGDVAEPFIQMFDQTGTGPIRIPYAEIRTIRFTGRDTAAGKSYEAWLRRKAEQQSAEERAKPAPRV